ncbi:MAG: hypothetical protein ACRC11_03005, partial [Xenococcaceae cyanobacterium]
MNRSIVVKKLLAHCTLAALIITSMTPGCESVAAKSDLMKGVRSHRKSSSTYLAAKTKYLDLKNREIQRMQNLLPEKPDGLGPNCSQRDRWGTNGLESRSTEIVSTADKILTQPFPAWNNEAYLRYKQDGNRTEGEDMMHDRQDRLSPLVIAECVQGKGKYLPEIEKTLRELMTQPTWILPAHDPNLGGLKGKYLIDLNAATVAYEIAQTMYLLKSSLSPELYEQMMVVLRQRIFDPMEQTLKTGKNKNNAWLTGTNNWNAVCLNGVVGAALAVLPSKQERAVFAAAGNHYIRNYLASFSKDGYAPEGESYWSYGFPPYVFLRELLSENTNGKVDLFAPDGRNTSSNELLKQRNIALYAMRIQMFPNNVAAFGDAKIRHETGTNSRILDYLNDVWGLNRNIDFSKASLPKKLIQASFTFARSKTVTETTGVSLPAYDSKAEQLGYYFANEGVMVSRGDDLAITIKAGGHKGADGGIGANTSHSHNDIGSYTIAIDDEQPTGDVGKTVYSAKTFNKNRYTIRAINSYGHPVPVVAGNLQQQANQLPHIPILKEWQTQKQDSMLIDMRRAYKVNGLRSLTRQMTHDRATANNSAQIAIEDRFAYNTPKDFETALTTLGSWKQENANTLILTGKQKSVRVKIVASAPWKLKPEKINEEGLAFTRIGIVLQKP